MNTLLFGAGRFSKKSRALLVRSVELGLGRTAKRAGELCLILVSDRKIRRINKEFLGKDKGTDVIAFGYQEQAQKKQRSAPSQMPPPSPWGREEVLPFGDIYVSIDRARRQAKAMKHPLLTELLTLAAHGALHLSGYDDAKASDRKRMFAEQERIVAELVGKP